VEVVVVAEVLVLAGIPVVFSRILSLKLRKIKIKKLFSE
jgi:hypothetical protein